MKKVTNAVLAVCALGLLFICIRSIRDTQEFDAKVAYRESVVKARLMEIDPHYVDVIIQRWEALTGREAVKA